VESNAYSTLRTQHFALELGFAFGLAQAGNAFALLPLAPLFEQFQAFKALEHIPFAAQGGSRAQTPML
jgi:hypothetical protein